MLNIYCLVLTTCGLKDNEICVCTNQLNNLHIFQCRILMILKIKTYWIEHFTSKRRFWILWRKLDGVSPVDNWLSNDKLHHFVKKKMWHMTRDTWHVTCDTWHVTCDTWHVTHDMDMRHMTHDMFGGVNILSKFELPSSCCLWFMILWRKRVTELINEWRGCLWNSPCYTRSVKYCKLQKKITWAAPADDW